MRIFSRALYVSCAVLFVFSGFAFSQEKNSASAEKIFVDDANYQEYRGYLGKWISVSRKKSVAGFIAYYNADPKTVTEVNRDVPAKSGYAFIPYGRSFIEKLEAAGIKRKEIVTSEDQFIWPVPSDITLSSVFGFRGREFHPAIDIPEPTGTIVRASMEGQIDFVGYDGGYGNVVTIIHRDSFLTRYAHNSVILVKKGDFVKKGQTIALSGSTGRSTGSHIHFEIRCNTIPLDPMDFLPDADKVPAPPLFQSWKVRKK
jgi:murein DD-endopeptidase MepM/ murein hydrolase activator NlpD